MSWDLNFLRRCFISPQKIREAFSNSHYETNFGVCCAEGAANPKIGFVKSPPLADF
jgi:hypothetical protein